LQTVLFNESLLTFSDGSDDEVGKFTVSIRGTENDCIEVKSSSTGIVDGISCGTDTFALLSRTGQTLEQNRFEYVKVCRRFLQAVFYLSIQVLISVLKLVQVCLFKCCEQFGFGAIALASSVMTLSFPLNASAKMFTLYNHVPRNVLYEMTNSTVFATRWYNSC